MKTNMRVVAGGIAAVVVGALVLAVIVFAIPASQQEPWWDWRMPAADPEQQICMRREGTVDELCRPQEEWDRFFEDNPAEVGRWAWSRLR